MTIIYNNTPLILPSEILLLSDLVKWKNLPSQGNAIALNDRLIKQEKWSNTELHDLDRVTVITAAFGG